MIYVEIFSHSNVSDGSITFEEGDLRIVHINDNDFIVESDFDKLLESVMEIDTEKLKPDEWYSVGLKRNWEDDGSGSYSQSWFEILIISQATTPPSSLSDRE